jgi:hypothetical protein
MKKHDFFVEISLNRIETRTIEFQTGFTKHLFIRNICK